MSNPPFVDFWPFRFIFLILTTYSGNISGGDAGPLGALWSIFALPRDYTRIGSSWPLVSRSWTCKSEFYSFRMSLLAYILNSRLILYSPSAFSRPYFLFYEKSLIILMGSFYFLASLFAFGSSSFAAELRPLLGSESQCGFSAACDLVSSFDSWFSSSISWMVSFDS